MVKSKLTSTHTNALAKVRVSLYMSQTMTCKQLILNKSNQDKFQSAQNIISEAINILNQVQ